MKQLFKMELQKTMPYTAFWALVVIYAVLFLLTAFIVSNVKMDFAVFKYNQNFQFPYIWNTFAWIASWYNLILSLIIIVLTCNEFSFKTFRQHYIAGLNYKEMLISKLGIVLFISLCATVFVFITTVIGGLILTENLSLSAFFSKTYFLGIYFVQTVGYLSFALFAAILLRHTALTIILFIVYPLFEGLVRLSIHHKMKMFFPSKVITNITPMPDFLNVPINASTLNQNQPILNFIPENDISTNMIAGIIYIAIFIVSSYFLLKKRNL